MPTLNEGVTGAKRQSWSAANPRDLLIRVLKDNTDARDKLESGKDTEAARAELLAELRPRLTASHIESIIEYWFSNNLMSALRSGEGGATSLLREERARAKAIAAADATAKMKERIKEKALVIVLDMMLPNGKKLRDCTGKECTALGGALSRIGHAVKPNQIIGAVLSEEQARKLYGRG